jgi:hypothetical protein
MGETTAPMPGTTTTTTDPTVPPDPTAPPDPTDGGARGYCTQACQTVQDCCFGNPECPGPYPDDWSCINGACVYGGCSNDVECGFNGTVEGWFCAVIEFGAFCLPSCRVDADCDEWGGLWRCNRDMAGKGYCAPGPNCGGDGTYQACDGSGSCDPDTGWCVCHDDAECYGDSVCTAL